MVTTAAIDRARPDRNTEHPTTQEKVSARLWLYPPRRMGVVPGQAILAAVRAGVNIEVGDVSIGIDGERHSVFSAIEQIFTGVGAQTNIALIATIQRADE